MTSSLLDHLPRIRAEFPGLATETLLFDNAGGSQLPRCVIDAMREYMERSYVQLGADYALSRCASTVIPRAREVVKVFLNGHGGPDGNKPGDEAPGRGLGDVIFGGSTTALCYEVASAYADARDALRDPRRAPEGVRPASSDTAQRLLSRDRLVVCTAGHEANVGPWVRLGLRGYEVVEWQAEPVRDARTGTTHWRPSIDTLRTLVNERTLLVLMPQVSNILGEVWDVRAAAEVAHAAGARIMVDGVAYAPHRAPDVAALGCDWYVYSTYKVFGPHMAAMFGTRAALDELTGRNHAFIDATIPYKWELGNANHEGAAGVAAVYEYARFLSGLGGDALALGGDAPARGEPSPVARADWNEPPRREVFERAFGVVREIEEALQARLLEWLSRRAGVRVIGPEAADGTRVPTISFVSGRVRSPELSRRLGERGIGVRWGHAYSKRLVEAMSRGEGAGRGAGGLDGVRLDSVALNPVDGVLRVSMQHYNTPGEVDRLIGVLEEFV